MGRIYHVLTVALTIIFVVQMGVLGETGPRHKFSKEKTSTPLEQPPTNSGPLFVTSPFYLLSPASTNLAQDSSAIPVTTSNAASTAATTILPATNAPIASVLPPTPPAPDLEGVKLKVKWQVEEMTDATRVVRFSIKNRHSTGIYTNLNAIFILHGASPAEEQIVNGNINLISNTVTLIDIPIYKPKDATSSFFSIPTSDELPPMDKPLSTVKSVEILLGSFARFLTYDATQESETAPPASPGK